MTPAAPALAALRQPWPRSSRQDGGVTDAARHFVSGLKTPTDFRNRRTWGGLRPKEAQSNQGSGFLMNAATSVHLWPACGTCPGRGVGQPRLRCGVGGCPGLQLTGRAATEPHRPKALLVHRDLREMCPQAPGCHREGS